MKHLLLLIIILWSTLNAFSQFSSSSTVYAYEYDYTDNDGIKSKSGSPHVFFVNFQNGIMEYVNDSKANVQKNLSSNPDYYTDKVISKLSNTYDKWKQGPKWNQFYSSQWDNGNVSAYRYNDNNSTYNTYTYQKLTQSLYATPNPAAGWSPSLKKMESWNSECWSFKSDHSTLIIWDTSKPHKKKYYKRTSISELKPSLDFLQ